MKKRYLILLLIPLFLVGSWYLKKYIELKYVPIKADQEVVVVEVTTKYTGAGYVDSTQAIKDGITQLTNAGGGVLFFGPGEYLVQDTIVIPSNITIQGVGAGEVGPTMIILGNSGDLNATGMSLLSIAPGAVNVVIKDVELRSMTPGPNFYPRTDLDRIQSEQTTAIKMYGSQSTNTNNILFQNLRITNFTYGIDVGSNDNSDPTIENIKIKNVSLPVNYLALRVKSLNAKNWDVQNFNIVEIAAGEYGMLLERTGTMSFLQLFCASTAHNGNLCLDIGQRSGVLYFVQFGYEGPSEGFRVRASSTYPIYFEGSAPGGTVEERNTIYSVANFLALDNEQGRIKFINGGIQSTLYTCRDVFSNYYPNPEERVPTDPYPGLANVPTGCNFDVTSIGPTFSTGSDSFAISDWLANGTSPSAAHINVKNYGAVGDGVADDTAAFRAAMQDTPGALWSANTILVPAGVYRITDTLVLEDGITFQGVTGAIIRLDATNRPLFKINAMSSDAIYKRGLGLKNLTIDTASTDVMGQQTSAVEMDGDLGVTGDVMFTDLNITNFTRGLYAHGLPELDTFGMRNLTFTNNGTAIVINDDNMSNWNLENIRVLGMKAGQRGIALDHGGLSVRGLTCVGESSSAPAEACMHLSRFTSLRIDGLTSTNTKYAFYGEWPDGWYAYPSIIKNSDLRDGFYSAGKMYLLSAGNIYSAGDGVSTLGSRSVYFDVFGSRDPLNVYPGTGSLIASCGDVFKNSSGANTNTLSFNGLAHAPQSCIQSPPADTTSPTVSITAPTNAATVSGSSVSITANATDNIGVVGVKFKVDGTNVGFEDTTNPYSIVWNSTGASNGMHTITALARDAAGNSTTSTAVSVTVNNIIPPINVATPVISPNGGAFTASQVVTLATSTTGATLFYTLDGSTPTSASSQYNYPLVVTSTTNLKVIATKSGLTDSEIASATFTRNNNSGGGGGTHPPTPTPTSSPSPSPTPFPTTIPTITPTPIVPTPPSTPGVILPRNVIAGQAIKFQNSATVYLVQSTGLHPFDTLSSLQAYQAKSGAKIIVRDGTASTYTVSTILASTILNQTPTPTPTPPATLPADQSNFVCSGSKTIYFYYKGKKEAYSEPSLYEAWNGKNYSSVQHFDNTVCASIPDNGQVRLPNNTIVKLSDGVEIYMISGITARPFASNTAYLRDSAGKTTYTISLQYLHTYARGANIY